MSRFWFILFFCPCAFSFSKKLSDQELKAQEPSQQSIQKKGEKHSMEPLPDIEKIYSPVHYSLDNGLKVVICENPMASSVAVGVAYNYGSCDDPEHLVGLAHFLEHMMFKGSKKFPKGEFDKRIMQWGGELNAWTWYDQTLYHEVVPAERLEDVLDMEADRMCFLSFDEKEVISERDVVFQERLMRLENSPFGPAWEAYLKGCFWYHPYQVPTIGYPQHIKAYNYDNVREAYNKWYAPNNATLIISGRILDLDTVKKMIKKYFGHLKKKNIPQRQRPVEPNHQGITHHITQENKRNSLILLEWNYACFNHRTAEKPIDYYVAVVLAHMIGAQTKELYKTLVEEKKLALSVECTYQGHLLDPYLFTIHASLPTNGDVKNVESIIHHYLSHLLKEGVNADELYKSKRDLISGIVFAKDGVMNAVDLFAHVSMGWSIEDIDAEAKFLKKVTLEDVNRVLRIILSQKPVCRLDLYPVKVH